MYISCDRFETTITSKMALIKNIGVGKFGVDSNILSTTGISSCIAAVIEFEDKFSIYHIDPSEFEKSTTGSINNGQILLMKIFDKLCRTDQQAIIKNTFLIGGWNNDFYTRLGQQIDLICNNSSLVMDYYHQFSSRNFHSFIKSIKLNLISFNLPAKSPDGKIKDVSDGDHPDDYVTDLTIICDRSYNLIIY